MMFEGPKTLADKAYEKWGMPLDAQHEGIVEEMQADMMVLVGVIYGLCTREDVMVINKHPNEQ